MVSQSQIGDSMKVAHRHEQIVQGEPVSSRAHIALAKDSDSGRRIGSPAHALQALVEKAAVPDHKWPASVRAAAIVSLSVGLWAVLIVGVVQLTRQLS